MSLSHRASKAIVGKIATTGAGKKVIHTAVPDEIRTLIVSLKLIVAKIDSPKTADEIEENLIKLILKAFFLENQGLVTAEDFLVADKPLREAFEVLVTMRDQRSLMKKNKVDESLTIVNKNLKDVEKVVSNLFASHVKPHTMKRIAVTFSVLNSPEFLGKGWNCNDLREERDELAEAMNRYLSFHFN